MKKWLVNNLIIKLLKGDVLSGVSLGYAIIIPILLFYILVIVLNEIEAYEYLGADFENMMWKISFFWWSICGWNIFLRFIKGAINLKRKNFLPDENPGEKKVNIKDNKPEKDGAELGGFVLVIFIFLIIGVMFLSNMSWH